MKWTKPQSISNNKLFLGKPERDFQKQLVDELGESVIGQAILYFAVDVENSNFHPVYGESLNKMFLPPIRVFATIHYSDDQTTTDGFGIDRRSKIIVHFHKRRAEEDQNLRVCEGDLIQYNDEFHEITKVLEPEEMFGDINHKVQTSAFCVKSRSTPNTK